MIFGPTAIVTFIGITARFVVMGESTLECPNYQYKCPDCPSGETCVYPNSGGCNGAGIPVCKAECNGIMCLTLSTPCPEDCPYSCRYTGPPCCPFLGEPICQSPCIVPCKETPCPESCPDSCFYPDADICCPKSGQPVCYDKQGGKGSSSMSPHSASSASNIHWNLPATMSDKSHWYFQGQEPSSNWFAQPTHNAAISSAGLGSSSLTSHSCPTSCPPLPTPTWGTCTTIQDEGSCCPSIACVGVPISVEPPELESNDDANNTVCADFIIPCPHECPDTCIYPQDALCPFQHQPVCPPKEVAAVANESESRETLEPILVSTPSAHIETTTVTEYVQTSSTVCPMIMYMCPKECPDNCIRPTDVPCPYAVPPHCP